MESLAAARLNTVQNVTHTRHNKHKKYNQQSALPRRFLFINDGTLYRPTANGTPPRDQPALTFSNYKTAYFTVTCSPSNQERIGQKKTQQLLLHDKQCDDYSYDSSWSSLTQLPLPAFFRQPQASLTLLPFPSWLPQLSSPALPPPAVQSSSTPPRLFRG